MKTTKKLSLALVFTVLSFSQVSHGQPEHQFCRKKDLKGIISCFSPEKPNWHSYEVASFELCNRAQNPRCTAKAVKNAFLRNVMPCQDSHHKVVSGEILLPKDPVTGCVYSPGHVQIGVHEGVGVVAVSIHTQEDHALYDGVVLRYLQENRPGVFSVYTRGIGNNKFWGWARTNEQIGPKIFNKQNAQIKEYLEDCFNGRIACD